jgi:predicted nuclease of predicted toxin-antitoxin system
VKLKLNENIARRVAQALERRGHQADTVIEEGLAGAADEQVLRAAQAEERLLVTLDRGMGDMRAYPPGSHAGILVLRPATQSAASVAALIEEVLSGEELVQLAGTIAIAQPGLLRVRRH